MVESDLWYFVRGILYCNFYVFYLFIYFSFFGHGQRSAAEDRINYVNVIVGELLREHTGESPETRECGGGGQKEGTGHIKNA